MEAEFWFDCEVVILLSLGFHLSFEVMCFEFQIVQACDYDCWDGEALVLWCDCFIMLECLVACFFAF